MMSVSKYIPTLRTHFQATARFFHLKRVLQKKNYDYDLDSLIEWKKETAKVFGSAHKPTKTGKIKKTKKVLDLHMEENLQILSTLSVNKEHVSDYDFNYSVKKDKKVKKSVIYGSTANDKYNSNLPSSSNTNIYGHGGHIRFAENVSMKDNYLDIPDDVFMSSAVPPDAVEIWDDDGKETEAVVYYDKDLKEDIIIPKLSPIPTCDSGNTQKFTKSLVKNHAYPAVSTVLYSSNNRRSNEFVNYSKETIETINSIDVISETVASAVPDTGFASSGHVNTKNRKTTRNNSSKTMKETTSSTISDNLEDDLNKGLSATEIFIPKVKPIPVETLSHTTSDFLAQLKMSSVPKPQTSVLDSVRNLPIEPPDSFEIIRNVPLFPMENSKWQNKVDSQLYDAFRTDIEQMCLNFLPSVKTILSKTMPDLNRFFLNRWREGLIKELGEEGFKKHQDATIRNGLNLHANIMEWLSGRQVEELQIMPDNEGHWSSLQAALKAISDVRGVELEIAHNLLNYRGVFDCLARYKDLLCMIDWKTSKKPRPLLKNTYDDPLQIAAYIGALNASEAYVKKYGEVSHGMIVVAYPDGSPAHIHVMNRSTCEKHWVEWTERLYSFYQLTYTEKMAANREKIQAKKVARLGTA